MKRFLILIMAGLFMFGLTVKVNAEVVDLEDLSLGAESYWNGSDGSGGFTSRGVFFANNFDMTYGSWDGFSYSNGTDTEISDWANSQYNAIPGEGANGSSVYAVGYCSTFTMIPPTITLSEERVVTGAYFTNTNYAYYSMLNGDMFAKKFSDGDWFKLIITGKDVQENSTGTVEVFLARGTGILDSWKWADLNALGKVKTLEFTLSSSDVGEWGMNTPAYFCIDNLTLENLTLETQTNSNGVSAFPYKWPVYILPYGLGGLFGGIDKTSSYASWNGGYLGNLQPASPYTLSPHGYPLYNSGSAYHNQYSLNGYQGIPLFNAINFYNFPSFTGQNPFGALLGNMWGLNTGQQLLGGNASWHYSPLSPVWMSPLDMGQQIPLSITNPMAGYL